MDLHKNNAKIFVLDTNVILHDSKCVYNFQENDVIIPIVVLEELDKFKKGNDHKSFHAREFVRDLDCLSGEKLFIDGVSLGKKNGRLFIATGKEFPAVMHESYFEKTPDHRILAITLFVKNKFPDRKTVLVTKDINLRMKAKSLGLTAEDYKSDKIKNPGLFTKSVKVFNNFDSETIDKLYKNGFVAMKDFPLDKYKLYGNQYLILRNGNQSVLVWHNPETQAIIKTGKQPAYGIEARNAEQTFALDALLNPDINLVSITGMAGTGKTLLALAAALQQNKLYKQILLSRPIVALSNQDLGFLPGNVNEKISPYMLPLFDNLTFIKNRFTPASKEATRIDEMMTKDELIITPLAYIRGRSLSNVYFIVDEAQNLTPHEVKTIITRAGEGAKLVFTGDVYQIDSPYLDMHSNGLAYLTEKMKGQNIFAHVNLVKGERSYLADLASKLL